MHLVQVRQDQNHMATTFVFRVSCAESRAPMVKRLLLEAHALVTSLENSLSEFLPDSPVHILNQARPLVRVRLGTDALELLERSELLRTLTDGSFDCAARSTPAPGPRIAWDHASGEAWRLDAGARLGFGAIGKGYALDRVRLILESHGFHDFLLAAGGSSLIFSGFQGPGTPWTWGWSWQKDTQGDALGIPFAHSTGKSIALGISGTHEKGAHLIDTRAAGALKSEGLSARSALIATASAADADALSTALFVSGYESARHYLAHLPQAIAMAEVDADGVPAWNGIFQQLWGAPAQASLADSARIRSTSAAPVLIAAALALYSPLAHSTDTPPTASAVAQKSTPGATQPMTPAASADTATATGEGAVDLGELSAGSFTPYMNERSPWWALFPLSAVAMVLIHLKKVRRSPLKKSTFSVLTATALLWATLEQAQAVDLEPMGKALVGVLGTPKAFKKVIGDSTFFYSKDAAGKAEHFAFIEKNVWQGSCTHTWIVGIGPDGKVTQVRAQEQQCPHARPAAAASFLDQYKGKGPADLAKLKGEVSTLAKATGSCELATEAVTHAVTAFQKIKGQI